MRLASFIPVALLALVSVPATTLAAPSNLYEWLATAPVVLAGENLGTYGKYAEFQIEGLYRGQAAELIFVNIRRTNRDRDRILHKEPLKFEEGQRYLLLLEPIAPGTSEGRPTFGLVRGVRGSRDVPAEGAGPLLEATERLVRIQDQRDDRVTWRELADMLDDTNRILIETALDQFLKFRRGDQELIGSLRPLLDHPAPDFRERTARLIGQILGRAREGTIQDAVELQDELGARARRDEEIPVRVAAVHALDQLESDTVLEILEEIAREDPEQAVRYAAETLMFDREERENRRALRARESDAGAPSESPPR